MLHRRTLTCFFAFLTINTSFSQINAFGEISINDPAHLHQLTTKRGDKFEGWIASWTNDSLVFVVKNDVRIAFPTKEVDALIGGQNSTQRSLTTQIFELKTKEGTVYYGFPIEITNRKIKFQAAKDGRKRFQPIDIEYIRPEIVTLLVEGNFKNEYRFTAVRKKLEGQLMGYQGGEIFHRMENGEERKIDIIQEGKYRLKPQHLPYTGHGRSLMFAQTGFGMKAGEKEFRNIMVGLNVMSFGLNENISVSTGLITIVPYADLKFSKSFGKFVHASVGAYGVVPFAIGVHGTVSLGTPDYFLNIGYNHNFENENSYTYSDFESFNIGSSCKVGRRGRVFSELHILSAPHEMDDEIYYDLYWETGYLNPLTIGYGWFNERFRFETGIAGIGPFRRYGCFPFECTDTYYAPIPFFSMAYKLR
jgi:hypothetical protein